MDIEELKFNQYKLYSEQRESFTERSFMINRFYMVMVLLLIPLILLFGNMTFPYGISAAAAFAFGGIMISVLWWLNMDSYNTLIRIKFMDIVDKMEKELPFHPYSDESTAIKEYSKNKKCFLFTGMQKTFAVISIVFFLVIVLNEITNLCCCIR